MYSQRATCTCLYEPGSCPTCSCCLRERSKQGQTRASDAGRKEWHQLLRLHCCSCILGIEAAAGQSSCQLLPAAQPQQEGETHNTVPPSGLCNWTVAGLQCCATFFIWLQRIPCQNASHPWDLLFACFGPLFPRGSLRHVSFLGYYCAVAGLKMQICFHLYQRSCAS